MIVTQDLIGTPFKFRGRGPDFYDCYGLVMEVSRRFGVELPDYVYPEVEDLPGAAAAIERHIKGWKPCEMRPGAILHFKVLDTPSHVGIVLNKFDFIHCWELCHGVMKEKIADWNKPHRLLGVYEYA
jgi:cell wall-associated NlpC family hydrolase